MSGEHTAADSDADPGEASDVPLAFSLSLLIPAFAVMVYVFGRLWGGTVRLPEVEADHPPDPIDGGEDPRP